VRTAKSVKRAGGKVQERMDGLAEDAEASGEEPDDKLPDNDRRAIKTETSATRSGRDQEPPWRLL